MFVYFANYCSPLHQHHPTTTTLDGISAVPHILPAMNLMVYAEVAFLLLHAEAMLPKQ